jgi:hypothetical protein
MVTATSGWKQHLPSIDGLPAKEQHISDVLRKPFGTFPQDLRCPERSHRLPVVKKMTGIRTETVATRVWASDIP